MKRIQFSLAALLILPLALSPLLVAVRECRNVAMGERRELGMSAVLLGFLYVGAFTIVDCRRRSKRSFDRLASGGPLAGGLAAGGLATDELAAGGVAKWRRWLRGALWGAMRGGLYGVLYYLLIFLPLAAADQYYTFWRLGWRARWLEFGRSAGWGFGIGLVSGVLIGGAMGVLAEAIWGERD